ncbi:hypothetical protein Pmani_014223 [Petrolisthes manimaculis]|uniref:MADF domain-containing protein n=1 Tax=Petrolisthes manimaculis TaxID=1843537 RepID=A0AAE1PU26_9EUCA|nr:hypothetical protein Pmani_014223 [Petrolisthes manimaculis]
MKKNAWKQIAQQLNRSEDQCKKRWTNLRDRYVRTRRIHERAIPSGSGSDSIPKIKWKYYRLLDSVLHHCVEHRTRGHNFQLGLSSIPDASSSPDESPETHPPDFGDILEIYSSEGDVIDGATGKPPVVAAGEARATNTPKRERTEAAATPWMKTKPEGHDWQSTVAQWITSHRPKEKSTHPADAAADYIRSQLFQIQDPSEQRTIIMNIFEVLHSSMNNIKHL